MVVNRIERAKQFLPFDALKGLQEALRKKESETEKAERVELSEESLEELENKFNRVKKGDIVFIKYYKNEKYIELKGSITKMDYIKKRIQVNNEDISIYDVIFIKSI